MMGEKGNVFGTDLILALLMCSPRSVFPWDIVVQRIGPMLFFDKRPESTIGSKKWFFI